jgi:hypothetical protein
MSDGVEAWVFTGVQAIFDRFDDDGDGVLSLKEMNNMQVRSSCCIDELNIILIDGGSLDEYHHTCLFRPFWCKMYPTGRPW